MSLQIYLTKWDLPENEEVIRDNRKYFALHTFKKLNEEMNGLTKYTDDAKYVSEGILLDKFDLKFPAFGLSTGGMTVLNIYYNPDEIFDTCECGFNALVDIRRLTRGRVVNGPLLTLPEVDFLVFDRIDQLDSAEDKIAVEKPNTIIFFDRGDLIFNKNSINEIFKCKDRIVLLDLKNTSIIPPECKTEIKMAVLNREATRMVLTDDSDGRQSEDWRKYFVR